MLMNEYGSFPQERVNWQTVITNQAQWTGLSKNNKLGYLYLLGGDKAMFMFKMHNNLFLDNLHVVVRVFCGFLAILIISAHPKIILHIIP